MEDGANVVIDEAVFGGDFFELSSDLEDKSPLHKKARLNTPRNADRDVEVGSDFSLGSFSLGSDYCLEERADPQPSLKSVIAAVEHSDAGKMIRLESGHTALLSGEWAGVEGAIVGNRVNMVVHEPTYSPQGSLLIDNQHANMLITHPDTLINTTLIADSFSCIRRAVLSSWTQPSIEDSRPTASLLCGSIVHTVVEECFRALQWTPEFIDMHAQSAISASILDIFACGSTVEQVRAMVDDMLREFPTWCSRVFSSDGPADLGISEVADIEEGIWSLQYGIKGKVDATLRFTLDGAPGNQLGPFELKTGKSSNSIAHRGQTLLYTLLLSDRHETPVPTGLLFYIANSELHQVNARQNELRGIILQRNRLANLLATRTIPRQITNQHLCRACYQRDTCLLVHRVYGSGPSETLPDRYEELTGGLTDDAHVAFLRHWDGLLFLEEAHVQSCRRDIWTKPDIERQAAGRCLPGLQLLGVKDVEGSGVGRFVHEFIGPLGVFSMAYLAEGDAVVVSSGNKYALAIGFVQQVHACSGTMVIGLDRKLASKEGSILTFTIDKDELMGSFGVQRGNLYKALQSPALRRSVIEMAAPQFEERRVEFPELSALDSHQQAAVQHVLSAHHYALILGMPGTGKTTTLATLLVALMRARQSVLITSHTHAAIDNLLLKALQHPETQNFLRLGPPGRVHHLLRESVLDEGKFSSSEELEAFLCKTQIVACTTMAINHPVFLRKRFDWCIVDEASQITLPACLGPLRFADRFVLVGDHYQLTPLVRSREAAAAGLSKSLFAVLSDAHPSSVAMLRSQYRMNADIMQVANHLIYEGKLCCGDEVTANRRFMTSSICDVDDTTLKKLLDPEKSVVFLDTDKCLEGSMLEERVGVSFRNQREAQLVADIAGLFVRHGISGDAISIISPYRPQLKAIQDCLSAASSSATGTIEVATVDQYQGRDKDCIIISLVRSNPLGLVGELLRDWHRINVAFTRAKCKLIICGSRGTLSSNDLFRRLLELTDERGWGLP